MEYELYHHGVKGMKWGVRRTAAQLGHPTSGKKKKLSKREERRREKERRKEEKRAKKPKRLSEMTDEELNAGIRRMELQKRYKNLEAETQEGGKKVSSEFMDKAVKPALQEAGKQLIRDSTIKLGKKLLGLDKVDGVDDGLTALKNEWKKLDYEEKIRTLKDNAKKASEEVKSQQKTDKSDNVEYATGTVTGEGTSRRSSQTSSGRKVADDIIDGEGWYVDDNVSSGRNYVDNYLALPAPRKKK